MLKVEDTSNPLHRHTLDNSYYAYASRTGHPNLQKAWTTGQLYFCVTNLVLAQHLPKTCIHDQVGYMATLDDSGDQYMT